MINSIHLAHVADAIAEITGDDDYDAVATEAYVFLVRFPELAGQIDGGDLAGAVRAVIDTIQAEDWLDTFVEQAGEPPF
jgi:hypothetical protein